MDYVDLDATVLVATDMALLCEIDGKEVWIPRSLIHKDSEVSFPDDSGMLKIPYWVARDKELI